MPQIPASDPLKIAWPHAPIHRLGDAGTYIVTCGTYKKLHHFRGAERLGLLHSELLSMARKYHWHLEAWSVFSNHYHFIGHSPPGDKDAKSLSPMLGELHSQTARWMNDLDAKVGRRVWHNFRETKLTFQHSYLSRLNYVHTNPVKHGLVKRAALYPWCSAGWFERTATNAQINTIYRMPTDEVRVYDDFEPDGEW